MSATDETAKVAELLQHFRIAMLTTTDQDGQLISRPMAVQEAEFDGDLWFFADRESREVSQIVARPEVGVALSSNSSWVSLSGKGEIVDDRAKARELWNSAVQAWFPEGPDADNIVLIRVRASGAEYWDSAGSRVTTMLSYAKSRLTGKRPDVGENERVEL
ncbi:MAG: pyridoxamine 5'-phosphate oxidase family protein [Actinomycetota bacterium]|nr:pyridoxamine 5'-phosphate oxidase family protein [Actinomycetota bacterium]MDQ2955728.1 pyridoxamine 5'-phosphate oxidase family protein [Actinomycetota bacterium]